MFRAHGFAILTALHLGAAAAVAQPPPLPQIPPPRTVEPPPTWEGSVPGDLFRPGSAGPYGVTASSQSPLLIPEPIALERAGVEPGWYADITLALVHPHLSNHVSSGTPLGPAFP